MTWQDIKTFFGSDYGVFSLFILIVLLTFLFGKLFRRLFKKFILESENAPTDPTNYQFFQHIITAVIYVGGFGSALYLIPSLRTFSTSLLAGAGIFAVAVGFASQTAFSNIIGGLFIVIFKPFRVNDRVTVGNNEVVGVVEDITLRHTVVRSFENRRYVVPNSLISGKIIINSDLTDPSICKFIFFKIGYDADLPLAMQIVQEEAERHPLTLDQRSEEQIAKGTPKVVVKVIEWSDYAVVLRASVWAEDVSDAFTINCDLNFSVKQRFDEAGIFIPSGLTLPKA